MKSNFPCACINLELAFLVVGLPLFMVVCFLGAVPPSPVLPHAYSENSCDSFFRPVDLHGNRPPHAASAKRPEVGLGSAKRPVDLKNEALELQRRGEYPQALKLMKRSVKLRKNSHTICLSRSELATLYVDMLKFDDTERTCKRILQEASTPYRYDSTRQVRLAKDILDDIAAERQKGLMHGMLGGIAGLKNRLDLNGRTGIPRGGYTY